MYPDIQQSPYHVANIAWIMEEEARSDPYPAVEGNGEADPIGVGDEESDDVPVDDLIEEVQREEVSQPEGKGRQVEVA